MTLDINALQTLEGEDTTGLSDCSLTCASTDGGFFKGFGTTAKPPFEFTVDITGSNGSIKAG
ncbi:ALQxL family class IV lanthipeptide [Streptomyces griseochromogenes]|uniref:ALQxL family class IV lanthipeptide n=1 Tax=Streptomyces griseochromogenes TaxID=68214 RepID=UPI00379E6F7A